MDHYINHSVVLITHSLAPLPSPHIALAKPQSWQQKGPGKIRTIMPYSTIYIRNCDYRVDTSAVFWFHSLLHSSRKLFHTFCAVLIPPKPPPIS